VHRQQGIIVMAHLSLSEVNLNNLELAEALIQELSVSAAAQENEQQSMILRHLSGLISPVVLELKNNTHHIAPVVALSRASEEAR
jgi:hypothetical protein